MDTETYTQRRWCKIPMQKMAINKPRSQAWSRSFLTALRRNGFY